MTDGRRAAWKRWGIRLGLWVGVPMGLFWAAFGVLMWSTFDGVRAMEDGARLGPAVRVVDGYVSCFVLEDGEGGVVLIDTCNDPEAGALEAVLGGLGHAPEDVRAILLTHGHSDHRQAIDRFPNARVLAHADELPLLRGEVAARGPLPQLSGRQAPIEVDDVLEDGDRRSFGALDVTVFHLRGHTDGSVAYLVGDTLFLGDNAHAMEDGTLEPAPWVFSDDTATNRASLRALSERLEREGVAVARMVFSHSGPLSSVQPLHEWARQSSE